MNWDEIIEQVKAMLKKEQEHLRWLIDSKIKFDRKGIDTEQISGSIDHSAFMVGHYKTRLTEYENAKKTDNGNTNS